MKNFYQKFKVRLFLIACLDITFKVYYLKEKNPSESILRSENEELKVGFLKHVS